MPYNIYTHIYTYMYTHMHTHKQNHLHKKRNQHLPAEKQTPYSLHAPGPSGWRRPAPAGAGPPRCHHRFVWPSAAGPARAAVAEHRIPSASADVRLCQRPCGRRGVCMLYMLYIHPIYICICICSRTHSLTHTHTHTHNHTYIRIYIHTYKCICTHPNKANVSEKKEHIYMYILHI